MVTTYIAAAFLLALLFFFIFAPLIIPITVNVIVSALLARKLAKGWASGILLFVVISALLSINVRFIAMVTDGFGPGKPPQVQINSKTLIGPEEKLQLDADSEFISYRRTTEPLRWGLQNDWQIGMTPVAVVSENPSWILKELGIASTAGAKGKAVLQIRSRLKVDGMVEVTALIVDDGKIAATYRHEARRNYAFESIDRSGKPDSGFVSFMIFLTQYTPWNLERELYPKPYEPFKEFLKNALGNYGLSESGAVVQPTVNPMNDQSKLIEATARLVYEQPLSKLSLPSLKRGCKGEDAGQGFTVAPWSGVHWDDNEIPPISTRTVAVDGYMASPTSSVCAGNHFWISAYHMKRIHIWHYVVDFRSRSLKLQEWVRADLPDGLEARMKDKPDWSRRGLHLTKVNGRSYEMFYVRYGRDSGGPEPKGEEGFEMEITLPPVTPAATAPSSPAAGPPRKH